MNTEFAWCVSKSGNHRFHFAVFKDNTYALHFPWKMEEVGLCN